MPSANGHPPPLIQVKEISKNYKSNGQFVPAVKNVSFQLHAGELFGLFGSNGAGKSTIIRMLATLLTPSSGTAIINGYDICHNPLQVRQSIGLAMAEERSFYGRLTIEQNLSFFATMQNVPRRQIEQQVTKLLKMFDLEHKKKATFQSLSSGQRQRLNIARALLHNPPILFLDEPTRSMDVQTSDFVKGLIKHELVGQQGKTVLFISHELYEMDNFCDRVVILNKGQVQATGRPAELNAQLPRRALYRLVVDGDANLISKQWQALPNVESVNQISQGIVTTAFDVGLANEQSGGWLDLLQVVGACGGRVESYHRVDDGSLRQIVKHFSTQEIDNDSL